MANESESHTREIRDNRYGLVATITKTEYGVFVTLPRLDKGQLTAAEFDAYCAFMAQISRATHRME